MEINRKIATFVDCAHNFRVKILVKYSTFCVSFGSYWMFWKIEAKHFRVNKFLHVGFPQAGPSSLNSVLN